MRKFVIGGSDGELAALMTQSFNPYPEQVAFVVYMYQMWIISCHRQHLSYVRCVQSS